MARRKKRKADATSDEADTASEPGASHRAPRKAPAKLASPFASLMGVKVPKKPKRAAATAVTRRRSEAPARRRDDTPGRGVDPGGVDPGGVDPGGVDPGAAVPTPGRAGQGIERYAYEDRAAFHQAFAGVRPLGTAQAGSDAKRARSAAARSPKARNAAQVAARAEAAEEAARARLDRLVAGGTTIDVRRNADGGVEGRRRGAPDRTLRLLAAGELTPEARLDLHGFARGEVAREINRFVRSAHRAGRRTLALIHGKGRHSEGGQGVLEGAVIKALKDGGAAPLVEAFVTAPKRHGGAGVLLLRLRHRL
ncbi:MAG: Smr/MutS family protein [Myxococcota bacterium]